MPQINRKKKQKSTNGIRQPLLTGIRTIPSHLVGPLSLSQALFSLSQLWSNRLQGFNGTGRTGLGLGPVRVGCWGGLHFLG